MEDLSTQELQMLLEHLYVTQSSRRVGKDEAQGVLAGTKYGLQDSTFWKYLQDGLAFGSNQQRKLCLAILRIVVQDLSEDVDCDRMHFRLDQRHLLLPLYERFCALYVTVVMNHYINQVEDCISELIGFMKSSPTIDSIWLLCLFSAAIEKSMQDSIRKLVGKFVLEHASHAYSTTGSGLLQHLETRLLPWASLGALYTSSIVQASERHETELATSSPSRHPCLLHCSHGDRVSEFLETVIRSHVDPEMRVATVKCVLRYLDENSGRLFSFSRAYILQGIQKGLIGDLGITLDAECGEITGSLSARTGYHEIATHCMTFMLETVAGRVHGTRHPSLNRISDSAASLRSPHQDQSVTAWVDTLTRDLQTSIETAEHTASVRQLVEWISESRHRCLNGEGLPAACRYLLRALDVDRQASSKDIQTALEALWQLIEIQEYPRPPLMVFPYALLHGATFKHMSTSEEFHDMFSTLVVRLLDLSKHRMYLFTSFATSLRNAILHNTETPHLPLEGLIANFAQNPPRVEVEFILEDIFASKLQDIVTHRTYEYYYGKKEGYAYAAFFDMINNVPISATYTKQLRAALDELLEPWIKQKIPAPVSVPWKNTTQLQVILLLAERCIGSDLATSDPEKVDQYLDIFWRLLAVEPLPRYRYLLEWIIARIILRVRTRREILVPLDDLDLNNPKLAVSQMRLALGIACAQDTPIDVAVDLMDILMVLAASPKVAIRHEAQWGIPILWDAGQKRAEGEKVFKSPAIGRMNKWIRSLDVYKRPPLTRLYEDCNEYEKSSLSRLMNGNYLFIEPKEEPRCKVKDFLDVHADDIRMVDMGDQTGLLPLGDEVERPHARTAPQTDDKNPVCLQNGQQNLLPVTPSLATASIPLQMKASGELSQLLGTTDEPESRTCNPVIVVASLIDNAYNLGGLSRVSEIFGCESLAVRSLKLSKSKEFTQVAVSSDLHLPFVELAPSPETSYQPLIDYLRAKKTEGYTVVAIEQTDNSRVLGDEQASFPAKVVLVLGSEKEGVPARLLGEVDWCIEVRQEGVTRSMNVQTAAAVVLYEISRQRVRKPSE